MAWQNITIKNGPVELSTGYRGRGIPSRSITLTNGETAEYQRIENEKHVRHMIRKIVNGVKYDRENWATK